MDSHISLGSLGQCILGWHHWFSQRQLELIPSQLVVLSSLLSPVVQVDRVPWQVSLLQWQVFISMVPWQVQCCHPVRGVFFLLTFQALLQMHPRIFWWCPLSWLLRQVVLTTKTLWTESKSALRKLISWLAAAPSNAVGAVSTTMNKSEWLLQVLGFTTFVLNSPIGCTVELSYKRSLCVVLLIFVRLTSVMSFSRITLHDASVSNWKRTGVPSMVGSTKSP